MKQFFFLLAVTAVLAAGLVSLAQPAAAGPFPVPSTCPTTLCPTNLHGWSSLGTCTSDQGAGLETCQLYRNQETNQLCRRSCVYL